jgi:hypothetical protein
VPGFHIPDKHFILRFFFLSRHGAPDPFEWCSVSSAWLTREINPGLKIGQFLDALEAGTVLIFRIFKPLGL